MKQLYVIDAVRFEGRITVMLEQPKVDLAVKDLLANHYKVLSVVRLDSYIA